jgi:FkbM family methyltransferase
MTPQNSTSRLSAQQTWYAENLPLRNQVILDVGANVGKLSEFFWDAAGGTSRVISIEPLAENVARIRERIRARNASNWSVEECAASATEGSVQLAVSRTQHGAGNSAVVSRNGTLSAPSRRLSALAPDATIVKLDIEGHEYAVLEDSLPRLPRVNGWAVELHQVRDRPLQPVLAAFLVHGFRIFGAVRSVAEPGNRWHSVEVPPTLDWSDVPSSGKRNDGSDFKVLHILARRAAP